MTGTAISAGGAWVSSAGAGVSCEGPSSVSLGLFGPSPLLRSVPAVSGEAAEDVKLTEQVRLQLVVVAVVFVKSKSICH